MIETQLYFVAQVLLKEKTDEFVTLTNSNTIDFLKSNKKNLEDFIDVDYTNYDF